MDEYMFTQDERQLSSGYRELISVFHAFNTYEKFFISKKGSIIIWMTDSSCLVSFLEKGSRVLAIQKLVIQIKLKEFLFGIKIKAKWISRETPLLKLADLGSKLHSDTDQFGLSNNDFLFVQRFYKHKFTIDGFSSSISRRTYKFISECPQAGSLEVDFFSHCMLSNEHYYIHPPPRLLVRLINKLILYPNVRGCIVLPLWRSHSFWNSIIKVDKFAWFVEDFMIFSPFYESFSNKTAFQGYKNFKTLVIKFNTSVRNCIKFTEF